MIDLGPGDTLLLYSDGITEAVNEKGEEFGEEKMTRLVEENSGNNLEELAGKIFGHVNTHSGECDQYDDMTLVMLRRTGE